MKSTLQQIIEEIEGLKQKIDNMKFCGSEGDNIEVQRSMGYNQCLIDVLKIIKKYKD